MSNLSKSLSKNIKVTTKTGLVLAGKLYKADNAKIVYIAITGVEGNINNNPFYRNIGNTLANNGIDFIVGHTRDAFNRVKSKNAKTGEIEFYGAWNERFSDADDDVRAYVDYAEKHGYEKIILGGQSLGANKVIHYLANNDDDRVNKFLLLSPVNVNALRRSIPMNQRRTILTEKKKGNDEEILPFKLFRWLRANVATAYGWLTDNTLNNTHIEPRGDFSQIRKVEKTGALLIGTHDGFTGGDPIMYLKNVNNHFKNKDENELIFITDASHIYRHHEQEVADKVLEIIEKWQ